MSLILTEGAPLHTYGGWGHQNGEIWINRKAACSAATGYSFIPLYASLCRPASRPFHGEATRCWNLVSAAAVSSPTPCGFSSPTQLLRNVSSSRLPPFANKYERVLLSRVGTVKTGQLWSFGPVSGNLTSGDVLVGDARLAGPCVSGENPAWRASPGAGFAVFMGLSCPSGLDVPRRSIHAAASAGGKWGSSHRGVQKHTHLARPEAKTSCARFKPGSQGGPCPTHGRDPRHGRSTLRAMCWPGQAPLKTSLASAHSRAGMQVFGAPPCRNSESPPLASGENFSCGRKAKVKVFSCMLFARICYLRCDTSAV